MTYFGEKEGDNFCVTNNLNYFSTKPLYISFV